MQISGKVLTTKITENGCMVATIQCNGKLPPKDESVVIKFGKQRTTSQNALYFVWLQFCVDNGGRDAGYFDSSELHEALAGRFLSIKKQAPGGFNTYARKSTTELTKDEFSEYFEKCQACVREYLHIDDASFWAEYLSTYSNIGG